MEEERRRCSRCGTYDGTCAHFSAGCVPVRSDVAAPTTLLDRGGGTLDRTLRGRNEAYAGSRQQRDFTMMMEVEAQPEI